MKHREVCLCVCMSGLHSQLVQSFVVHQTFRDMQDPEDPLYDAALATGIKEHLEEVQKEEEQEAASAAEAKDAAKDCKKAPKDKAAPTQPDKEGKKGAAGKNGDSTPKDKNKTKKDGVQNRKARAH